MVLAQGEQGRLVRPLNLYRNGGGLAHAVQPLTSGQNRDRHRLNSLLQSGDFAHPAGAGRRLRPDGLRDGALFHERDRRVGAVRRHVDIVHLGDELGLRV